MGYKTGTDIADTVGDISLTAIDPNHPIFAGIELGEDGSMVNPYAGVVTYADGTRGPRASRSCGTRSMTRPPFSVRCPAASADASLADTVVIAEIPAGATLEHDGGAGADVLAAPRLLMLTGAPRGQRYHLAFGGYV